MSRDASINFVLQRVLRKIGAYPISSSGPRPAEMEEARYWFDMVVGHLAGRKRTWWLVDRTATFALIAGQREYQLDDVLAPDETADGLQAVIGMWIDDAATGVELERVSLLRREEFEGLIGGAVNDTGVPSSAHIDRQQKPLLRFLQAPDAARSYQARVLFQTYAPDLTAGRDIAKIERFRSTWNLYLVAAVSAVVGNGPVRKLPADEVRDMKADAEGYLRDLEAYDDHEQHDEPQQVRFSNGI